MRPTYIRGPFTGEPYRVVRLHERANGTGIYGFPLGELRRLIANGDGRDGNGEGLRVDAYGEPYDVTCGTVSPVGYTLGDLDGTTVRLYLPADRIWDETTGRGRHIGHDEADNCRACGEHVSAPHLPDCPAGAAARLREAAEDAPPAVALAQRLTADLVEMDHTEAIRLDDWPEARAFVDHVTAELASATWCAGCGTNMTPPRGEWITCPNARDRCLDCCGEDEHRYGY